MDAINIKKVSNLTYNQYTVSQRWPAETLENHPQEWKIPLQLFNEFSHVEFSSKIHTYCVSVPVNLERCTLTLLEEFCL
jgi:hypothetical protein